MPEASASVGRGAAAPSVPATAVSPDPGAVVPMSPDPGVVVAVAPEACPPNAAAPSTSVHEAAAATRRRERVVGVVIGVPLGFTSISGPLVRRSIDPICCWIVWPSATLSVKDEFADRRIEQAAGDQPAPQLWRYGRRGRLHVRGDLVDRTHAEQHGGHGGVQPREGQGR